MGIGIAPNLGDGFELLDGRWAAGVAAGLNFTDQNIAAHAGGLQPSATQIGPGSAMVNLKTVASAGDSVKLPAAKKGTMIFVLNGTATSANVFGFNSTDTINGTAGSTAVAIAGNKAGYFFCPLDGAWGFTVTA